MYFSYDILQYIAPIALLVGLLIASFRIVAEYERIVVLFLGRFQAVKIPVYV